MPWNAPWWQSIAVRLTLATLAMFLVGIWSLSYYISQTLHKDMESLLGDQQFSTVSRLAAALDSELDSRLTALKSIASVVDPTTMGSPAAVQALLKARPLFQVLFNDGIFATGADGIVRAEAAPAPGRAGADLMAHDFIAAALQQGRATIGRPVAGGKTGAAIVTMAVPIRDAQGRVIGAMAGVTDLAKPNFLDKTLSGGYGKAGGYLLVSRQDRRIIFASDKRLVMQPAMAPGKSALVERAMQGGEGTGILVNQLGVEVLGSAKPIRAAGWYLGAMTPTAEAFAPIYNLQRRLLAASILLTLLASGLTWWIVRRQLAPMLNTMRTLAGMADAGRPLSPIGIHRQDEVGALTGAINGLLQTITKRESALFASEERYRALIDSLPEPVFVHRDGLLVYLNAEATRVFGAARAVDLIGTPILERVHPEFRDLVTARARQISQEDKTTPLLEHKFLKLDGTPITVETQGTPIQFDGQPAIMIVGRDISTRVLAQEALRASDHRYRRILSNLRGAILVMGENEQVEFCNTEFTAMFRLGMPPESLTGVSAGEMLDLITASYQDPGEGAARVKAIVANGLPVDSELVRMTEDRSVLRDFAPIVIENQTLGRLWYHHDITELARAQTARASLEAQLRETQKMAAIGTLAGGIAHDFNNILAAILGNADLAHEDVRGNGPVEESLDEIRKAGLRGRDLVKQILAFSRRQPTERKRLDLAEVVEDAARLLRVTLPGRIALEVDCTPGVPPALADATQIEQVVLNMATNAVQAMRGAPGRVCIRLDAVELDANFCAARPALRSLWANHPGRALRLTVSDNGPGMSAEVLERIFEPFFTTKPVGEGTGLGLAVVHGIIENHEGAIEAASTPGAGASFTLYLPCADPFEAEATETSAASRFRETASGSRVLYIDDDEALVSLVTRLLERRGFRVTAHTNQKAALAALRADPAAFDLVVTDYNMPGMSGLDVARAVRAIRPGLPVAVASGFVDETLTEQAAAAGVREVIFKATSVDEYCSALQRIIRAEGVADAR